MRAASSAGASAAKRGSGAGARRPKKAPSGGGRPPVNLWPRRIITGVGLLLIIALIVWGIVAVVRAIAGPSAGSGRTLRFPAAWAAPRREGRGDAVGGEAGEEGEAAAGVSSRSASVPRTGSRPRLMLKTVAPHPRPSRSTARIARGCPAGSPASSSTVRSPSRRPPQPLPRRQCAIPWATRIVAAAAIRASLRSAGTCSRRPVYSGTAIARTSRRIEASVSTGRAGRQAGHAGTERLVAEGAEGSESGTAPPPLAVRGWAVVGGVRGG